MPVYNADQYLKQAIESVINQTYSNWQLVLIDDGSTDHSGEICDFHHLNDSRITVIHKKNQGVLSARVDAIKHASGDYILFIDADDFYSLDLLEKVYSIIVEKKADIIFFSYNKVNNQKLMPIQENYAEGFVNKNELYHSMMTSDDINSMCTKAFNAKLLKDDKTDYSYYYDCAYGEDKLQLLAPLTKAMSVYYLNEHLYYYRINCLGATLQPYTLDIVKKRMNIKIWNLLRQYVHVWNLESEDNLKQYSAYYLKKMISVFCGAFYYLEDTRPVLNINWRTYIPDEVYRNRTQNPYISIKEQIKIFCIVNKIKFPFIIMKRKIKCNRQK